MNENQFKTMLATVDRAALEKRLFNAWCDESKAEAEVQTLRAKLRDRERRIREARRDLERRGVLRLSVSEELLDLRRGRKGGKTEP